MESPKSNSQSKLYFSDDDESIEHILLYLINEAIKFFSLTDLKELPELLNISVIKDLLLKMYTHLTSSSLLLIVTVISKKLSMNYPQTQK